MAEIIEEYLSLPEREQRIVSTACREPANGLSVLRLYFPAITPADLRTLLAYIAHHK